MAASDPVVIIGAGLAGLSTAFHLGGREHVLLEKGNGPGGLASSREIDGFTFDYTGHLLHLRHPAALALVESLAGGLFELRSRKASVRCGEALVPYPFQANLHGLPTATVYECLDGFVQTLLDPPAQVEDPARSFRDWAVRTFGEGIAKHFLVPYNEKIWCREASALTADWVAWAVPRPSLEEVLRGALGIVNEGMGYNATFRYPARGGIGQLAGLLAARLDGIRYGEEVVEVDPGRQRLRTSRGETISYSALVNTVPLPSLVERLIPREPGLAAAAAELDWVDVYDLNLGIDKPVASDRHWIYFPGAEYPFYRVGFPTNFSEGVAPPGAGSIYVEIAVRRGERPDEGRLVERALEGLLVAGLLRRDDRILVRDLVRISPAYVVFDLARRRAVPFLLEALRQRKILSIGRYGGWTYSSMETALLDGMAAAAAIAGGGAT